MDPNSEARLELIHPVAALRVHNLAAALSAEGFQPAIDQGIRSVAQQNEMYAQGRTLPGEIITDAKGTESNHVMGFAVDFFFVVNSAADWKSPGFDRLAALAPSYGLRSGASWGDRPHVELQEFPAKPTPEMQQVYAEGGVAEVWKQFPIPS